MQGVSNFMSSSELPVEQGSVRGAKQGAHGSPHHPDMTTAKACLRVSAYPSQAGAICPMADSLLLTLLVGHCFSPRVSFAQCQCRRPRTNPDSGGVHHNSVPCLQDSSFLARPQFLLAAKSEAL